MARFVNNLAVPNRGEIWWVKTPVRLADGVTLEHKPWLILQDNRRAGDVRWPELLAVRITSNTTHQRPSHVPLTSFDKFGGVVLCETLTSVPRWRLVAAAGALTPSTMERVEEAVRGVLGMGDT